MFSNWSFGIWVMLASRASESAASIEDRFVVCPSIAITRVKSTMCALSMPSWPAASPMVASSVAATGISSAICRRLARISSPSGVNRPISSTTPSAVFITPANALSKSELDLSTAAPKPTIGSVALRVMD